MTVETCPHYLTFAAEEIPDGDPRYKCAPPIRERENRERLWEGLRQGLIDTIGTDHSPAPPELKHLDTGDVFRAWGGIASLQLALPAVWTEARRRGFTLADLARWMALRPAELVGLSRPQRGDRPGPRRRPRRLRSRAAPSPSTPRRFIIGIGPLPTKAEFWTGRVEATYLRGRAVYRNRRFAGPARGQTLLAASPKPTGAAS